ncbi:hypothetical protein ACOT1K_09145 [Providencia manganoxydans]|uniref:hypothetical protein n=1 Tax=Providencia manganoxydans TaxID=2923283 RepID=UPI003B9BA62E
MPIDKQSFDWLVGWLAGCLAVWLFGCLAVWLFEAKRKNGAVKYKHRFELIIKIYSQLLTINIYTVT